MGFVSNAIPIAKSATRALLKIASLAPTTCLSKTSNALTNARINFTTLVSNVKSASPIASCAFQIPSAWSACLGFIWPTMEAPILASSANLLAQSVKAARSTAPLAN